MTDQPPDNRTPAQVRRQLAAAILRVVFVDKDKKRLPARKRFAKAATEAVLSVLIIFQERDSHD